MLAAPPSVDVSGLQEEVDGLRATATQAQSTAERCMKRLADMGERLEALELQGPPMAAPAALPSMPSSAAAAAAGGELETWLMQGQYFGQLFKLCNAVGQPREAPELQGPPVAALAALPDASMAAAAVAAGGELAVAGQAG